MATGDCVATQIGTAEVGSAALTTLIDSVNITAGQYASGGKLYLIPVGHGQINVVKMVKES